MSPVKLERSATTAAIMGMLTITAVPLIAFFPDPPAFGRQAVALIATFAVVAVSATAWRKDRLVRGRILRRSALSVVATVAAAAGMIVLHGSGIVVALQSHLTQGWSGHVGGRWQPATSWLALWLISAAATGIAARLQTSSSAPAHIVVNPWERTEIVPPWNAATILLWAVGWCAVLATVVEGHRTAAFLTRAVHADGMIASDDAHPLIRFTTADGRAAVFRQNGGISRRLGASVPVAYDSSDPDGTARANTFFALWGEVAGLAWIGLGSTLFPFFGIRAAFGRR